MGLRGNYIGSDKIFWLRNINVKPWNVFTIKQEYLKLMSQSIQIKRLEEKQYLKKVEGKKLYYWAENNKMKNKDTKEKSSKTRMY